MRVLHLDAGREMRGGQWQAVRLIEGLEKLGHSCTLLTLPGSALSEEAHRRSLHCETGGWAVLARLWRQADICHAHDARSHTWAAVVKRGALAVSRRVAFPIGSGWLSRWKYQRADHYIAVSGYVRQILCAAGIPPERVSVVYDGAPLDVPAPAAGAGMVLAVATTDPMKGSDLVQAATLAEAPLLLSNDLPKDLPNAAVFLYLTREEGLGSAALLAMAHRLPVIASRVGGLPEIVEDGVTGLLVENRPDAIRSALAKLLGNPEMRRRMGEAGRQRVEERFSVDAMVRHTEAVYRDVAR